MMSNYQLKIADLYNPIADPIADPIGNVKKLVSNFFDGEKYVFHYEKLEFYLRLGQKLKKNRASIELNRIE